MKVKTVSGGTCVDIKNIILSESDSLNGVVFIGDIPSAYYEIQNDHPNNTYSYWQCELYYMDLNGTWLDNNNNNIFDNHLGNVAPEIFVGRISTAYMGNWFTEKEGLENYLDKLHNFYLGNVQINNKFAMAYTDTEWANNYNMCHDIRFLYGNNYYDNYNAVNNPSHGKPNYLSKLSDTKYEFIQLAAHSGYNYHEIRKNMPIHYTFPNNIININPKAIAYNLFCCSSCRWPTASFNNNSIFIGTSFIYNNSPKSLTVVGSTKTGSMLQNKYVFYQNLNSKKVIGESFLNWWKSLGSTHNENIVRWYYGMCILGDPMISMFQKEYMSLDLCIKDSDEDNGVEPNVLSDFFWESNDIWVRHSNDNSITHQNPEYEPDSPNYVKVRIRNIGTTPNLGNELLKLYWTKASTSYQCPYAWSSSNVILNPNNGQGVQCGGIIDSVAIPIIQPGDDVIISVPWVVPNPANYNFLSQDPMHFALLARIVSKYDTMSFQETPNTLLNIKNNNNIACKSINIVDVIQNTNNFLYLGSSTIIRNPTNLAKSYDVLFSADSAELGPKIFVNAEVKITMDNNSHSAWIIGGEQSQGLIAGKNDNEKIVVDNNAQLLNIVLAPYECGVLNISYNFLTEMPNDKRSYKYRVIQKETNSGNIVGGQTYIINCDDREPFYANIDISENNNNQNSTLIARNINEPAIYNWYDSQSNLIYS